jgi:23S rRNA pseudouridine1911/1915/1917 synthase
MDERAPLKACEIPLDVIYEDQWIIVINKPAGLTVHPGAGNTDGTLVNALLAKYPQIKGVGDPDRPGIVHRLDKMTSGVMVVARSSDSHAILANAFKTHEHRRVYVAICYGHMPQIQGTIETFMQRNPKDRKKMTSRADKGRRAVTHWEVVKQWKGFSLLLLTLQTGRTHQIRVHLSDMGHPVVGDAQYGGRRRANSIEDPLLQSYMKALDRQMLHAFTLGITHPITNKQMEFKSEMPDDMNGVIRMLDERDLG